VKKKCFLVWTIVVIVVCALVYGFVLRKEPAAEQQQLSTAQVTRGAMTMIVTCTGLVVSNLDVDIKCKASGEVKVITKDVSENVKKGELLVELDPVNEQHGVSLAEIDLKASVARVAQQKQNLKIAEETLVTDGHKAEAALKSAQASAEDLRNKANKTRQLYEKNVLSHEECDTAETLAVQAEATFENARLHMDDIKMEELMLEVKRQDVALAEAQEEADEITLADAKQRLTDTKVFSPIDGVISARNAQIGQIVGSGINNIGGGTTLLTVSDLSHTYILASVDESDIGQVKVDQPVSITADAFPLEKFGGKVVRIATTGVNTSNVVTFEVKIEVLGENRPLLKPQMTANVNIILAKHPDALTVPIDAVTRDGGRSHVVVVHENGETEERAVTTGISDATDIEIVDGVKEGETVVASGSAPSRFRNQQQGPPNPMMMFRKSSGSGK